MKPSLKLLWLCLLAVCAFGAVAASSASAVTDHFTCATAPCTLTGELDPNETLTFGTRGSTLTLTCNRNGLHATVASVSVTQFRAHPSPEECTMLGGSAPFDTTGCDYIYTGETHAFTNTVNVPEGEDATVDLVCEGTNKMKITGPGCTISFGSQNGLMGVRYTNKVEASGTKDVTIDVTFDVVVYEGSGLLCPAAVKGAHNDGFLTEKITVKGHTHNESARVNFEVS